MKYKVYYRNSLCKTMQTGDKCVVNMSEPPEDTIVYSINLQDNTIYARIINPSQHTRYLVEHNSCYIYLNVGMTKQWARYRGWYSYGPDGTRHSWQRGLQWTSHPYWKKLGGTNYHVKVDNLNNEIILPFPIDDWPYSNIWYCNNMADYHGDPARTEYYIEFKPILVSVGGSISEPTNITLPNIRAYKTNAKITRLTIERD